MRSDVRLTNARGAIAIQFAMLAFGFFAIAAVVIDVRLASLAQQQMQVAADFAALEGLGERDNFNGAFLRTVTRDTVRRSFDDDLLPANGDPSHYGAGPVISLTGGQPESNGSALLTVSPTFVYDPVLELNVANARSGDIVRGTFNPNDQAHDEAADYSRTDFVPSSAAASQALLVRLRRTADRTGLDRIAGVSSSGPPLPFLFGLGSTMHGQAGSSYNPRTDGLSVSATSIAAARRSLEISGPGPNYGFNVLQEFVLFSAGPQVPLGQPFPPPGQFGTTPAQGALPPGQTFTRPRNAVGEFRGIWDLLVVGGAGVQVDVDVDGILVLVGGVGHVGGGTGSGNPHVIGYFAREVGTQGVVLTRVGQIADLDPSPRPLFTETFVPIARSVSGAMRVIGFGWIRVVDITPPGGGPRRMLIQKLQGGIRLGEANAVSVRALAALSADPALVVAHATFPDSISTPVLVR